MNLFPIHTGNFKLDGGAMFGVVPKTLWSKTNPADDNNLCSWAMRCLLVEDGDNLILIDNGIGDKQDAKFMGHYYLHGDKTLDRSLASAGFNRDDITDVFLSHLHFDHCGGSIRREGERLVPAFKNAIFWSNKSHWQWATEPNDREKASFLKDNILPIKESGQLRFVDHDHPEKTDCPLSSLVLVHGHTESMMLPKMGYKGRTVVFMADLLPSIGHIPLPYVMAYDTRPLLTLQEKKSFLQEAVDNDYVLFLEHDVTNECCDLQMTDKGIRVKNTFRLSNL